MLKPFLLALSLLTRFPINQIDNIEASDSGKSALFYPLIGLIIGLVFYIPILFFNEYSQVTMAAVVTVLGAIITGGLHLDGLADSADGWLGGMGDRNKTIKIMKDPVVGSAGVIAIVSILLLKFAIYTNIFQSTFHGIFLASGIIIVAPIISRAMILLLLLSTEYTGGGMAEDISKHLPLKNAVLVVLFCLILGFYFSAWGLLFVLMGFWLLRRLMIRTLGGSTGDTIGATVEITEVLFLLGSVF